MFGSLISGAIRAVTLPVDATNATLDIVTGGDGSKASRTDPDNCSPLALVEKVRDAVADAAEKIDD